MSLLLFYQDGAPGPALAPSVADMTPDLELRCTWRPQQFDRCTNPGFEADTTGWAVTAGRNGAGTSVTRITTDSHGGAASGQVVTTNAGGSGVHYAVPTSDAYYRDDRYATVYTARLWLRRVSGGRRAELRFGSSVTSDYAVTAIEDLSDQWREYSVSWRPGSSQSHVQVAVVIMDQEVSTFRVDDLTIYSPLPSQVANGTFEVDVYDWVADGSLIGAAASSFVQVTGGAWGGTGYALLTTTTTDGSGAAWDFGQCTYLAGRTYRLRVALARVSGAATARLRLGSLGTPADRADATVTLTQEWAWYTLDWTPSADRSDVALAITNAGAAALVVRVDEVEVYEALDDVGLVQSMTVVQGTMSPGVTNDAPPGTASGEVADLTGLYDARNPASALYGSVDIDVPVFARASWGGRLYPLACGLLTSQSADPDAKQWQWGAGDGLAAVTGTDITRPFGSVLSYAQARQEALLAAGLSARQFALDASGPEAATFFDGTDGPLGVLAYLEALNSATGTLHYAQPSVHANVGWVYTTVPRTRLTDDHVDYVMDNASRGPLASNDQREDGMVTRATVGWHGYEPLQPPNADGVLPWQNVPAVLTPASGRGPVVVGGDRSTWPDLLPYMVYTDEAYGSTEAPEPEVVVSVLRYTVRNRKGKRVGRRHKHRYVRWEDPIFPMVIEAGRPVDFVVDFAIPMEDAEASIDASGVAMTYDVEPGRVVVHLAANPAPNTVSVVYGLGVTARPWFPKPDAQVSDRIAGHAPAREANGLDESYINGPGQAQGLARYLLWRWGASRLRFTLMDAMAPQRQLTVRPGAHITATVDRYHISALPTVVRGVQHRISRPWPWRTDYAVEELPAGSRTYITLGGGASLGLGSSAVLAR